MKPQETTKKRNGKQTLSPREGPPVAPNSPAPTNSFVPNEQIRERAHQIFLARGGTPGNELDDWLLAERELKRERAQANHPPADL
jgi:hypothetical protein